MSSFSEKMLTKCLFQKLFKNPFYTLDQLFSPIYKKYKKSYMNKIPVNNKKILLTTFNGAYTCNPKAIANEIIKRNLPWEIVWVIKSEAYYNNEMPKQIKTIIQGSEDFYKEAASAKIWITNGISMSCLDAVKKKNQIYFQTWHGAIGIKRFDTNKDKQWIKKIIEDGKQTDYCISNSKFETNLLRSTFWKNAKMLEYGHARNDVLFKTKQEQEVLKIRLRRFFNLPDNTKIALYAPTFRDDGNIEYYNIDYIKLKETLEKKFGGEWIILTRLHSRMKKKSNKLYSTTPNFVINSTRYEDIQDLMVLADVGITDYSSWICEYMLTGKPGFLYGVDINSYSTERGFLFPLSDLPFPLAENNKQLTDNILNFEIDPFLKKSEEFLSKHGCVDDGHAAERVVDKLIEIIDGGQV